MRMYLEITRDRKLRRHPPPIRWTWIAVMVMARQSPEAGRLLIGDGVPATIEDIADEAAVSVKEAQQAIDIFITQHQMTFIDGVYSLINFAKRQPESDSSTSRVRKHRDKKRTNETLQKRYGNALDTDIEEDTENTPPTPPQSDKPKETIEDVLARFPRYSNEQLTVIREYWDMIKFTRQNGTVAASIVATEMNYWEKYPVETVIASLELHCRKYPTKREEYTRGIIRRSDTEIKLRGKYGNTVIPFREPEKLAKADCPNCHGKGYYMIAVEDVDPPITQRIKCACWSHPTKT